MSPSFSCVDEQNDARLGLTEGDVEDDRARKSSRIEVLSGFEVLSGSFLKPNWKSLKRWRARSKSMS